MNANLLRDKFFERLVFCLLFLIFGCQPDYSHFEPAPGIEGRIMDQLRADPEFSLFVEALELTEMDAFLNRSGLWTVIAPTDEAFHAAGIDFSSMSRQELTALIGFHVLERMMFTFDFAQSKFSSNVQWRYASRSKKFVTVATDGNAVNGIPFIETKKNIAARNGVIHGIAQVMFPDPSIDNYLGEREDVSIFFQALQHYARYQVDGENSVDRDGDGIIDDTVFVKSYTQVVDLANESAIKTVYAPTNAAFQAFFNDPEVPYDSMDDFDMSDPVDNHILTTLLNVHLAAGSQPASGTIPTSGQETITIAPADVQTADIAQSNGAIHVLNKVTYPPSLKTVPGRILMDKDLSKFAAALLKSSLVSAYLPSGGIFTAFVPTNDAFVRAGIDPGQSSVTPLFLSPILRYHLVTGRKVPSEEIAGTTGFLPTSHGTFMKYENSGVSDDQGGIGALVSANQEAGNGIVHKIDKVLMPPVQTVAQLLTEGSEYSQFRAALTRAGLLSELEQGNISVFAPDNEAFFKLYGDLNAPGGLTDISIPRLDSILKYHLVPNRMFSSELSPQAEIVTRLNGQRLTSKVVSGNLFLTDGNTGSADARITRPDRQGTNGVVHRINGVLLPKAY